MIHKYFCFRFRYPDPTYLTWIKEELAAKGVTESHIIHISDQTQRQLFKLTKFVVDLTIVLLEYYIICCQDLYAVRISILSGLRRY